MDFAKTIKMRMAEAMMGTGKTGGLWNGKEYDHICRSLADNFIDGIVPVKSDIKGSLAGCDIRYHECATHLNSSQITCISFFRKFFERPEWEHYLIELLRKCGLKIEADAIRNAAFEYMPDAGEGTNFDFYMEMENGAKISFEIKYTERAFGGISPHEDDPDKYSRKWREIYSGLVERSSILKCSEEEFFENYQINRNIAYAGDGDSAVFITPEANDAQGIEAGRAYIDYCKNRVNDDEQCPAGLGRVFGLYWEDVVDILMKIIDDDSELSRYYTAFTRKYIDVLRGGSDV